MMKASTCVRLAAIVAVAAVLMPVRIEAADDPIKASIKCRNQIGAQANKIVKTALKVVDDCHAKRDKGKRPASDDCNELAVADVKDKLPSNSTKVAGKLTKSIDKKCAAGEVVRDNYTAGVETSLVTAIEDAVEADSQALLGAPDLVGDKAAGKCHKAIAKGRSKIIAGMVKDAIKCQKKADKSAQSFGELAAACLIAPVKTGPKAETSITKACTPKNAPPLEGGDVGSCAPLPGCVVDTATATGETLAEAVYGKPAECGNGAVEAGETCDDGNLVDGDGCDSNCTATGCGNGIVTAGEACDDGNALTSDACPACQDAVCGDGFVEAGVELCGDAPTEACETPDETTCPVVGNECAPAGTTRSFEVRFTPPAGVSLSGLTVLVDYPETSLRLPGAGTDSSVTARVTNLPAGFGVVSDSDFTLAVSRVSTEVLPAGRFFTVEFDDCTGASAPTLDQFACIVEEASDTNSDIVDGVTCAVVAP